MQQGPSGTAHDVTEVKTESMTQHTIIPEYRTESWHKGKYCCLRCNKQNSFSKSVAQPRPRTLKNNAVAVSQWLRDEGIHYTEQYIKENHFCNRCYIQYHVKYRAKYEGQSKPIHRVKDEEVSTSTLCSENKGGTDPAYWDDMTEDKLSTHTGEHEELKPYHQKTGKYSK